MNIMLLSDNPIVEGMVKISTRSLDVKLHVATEFTEEYNSYELIVIDDAMVHKADLSPLFYLENTLLLQTQKGEDERFAYYLQKPFLPSQFKRIVEEIIPQEERIMEILDEKEADKIKDILSKIEEDEMTKDETGQDLDSENSQMQIEQRKYELIKEQLEAQGLEIVSEDEMVQELLPQDATASDAVEDELSSDELEYAIKRFVKTLKSMKRKKREKLLAGKKIKCKLKS